ncbi:hypothetical protein IAR55_005900 [Kwoniella newhampshirensis]|uniref:Uncharacterized protein n=1 Tax=Kwoniella newhampshirensis TaxID=1651941 RepID=A0AAW0YVS6_9TREE
MSSSPSSSPSVLQVGESSRRHSMSSPPQPSRLTRSDFAAYASILDGIQTDAEEDLAKSLMRRREDRSTSTRAGEPEVPDVTIDDEVDNTGRQRSVSRPRRVDGPEFAPVYQDAVHSTAVKKRKKLRKGSVNHDGTRWPLPPSDLPTYIPTLEETIVTFASTYIRENRLFLPSLVSESEDDDPYPLLPPSLVPSTIRMINQILVNLAGVRPAETKKRRKTMSTMDGSAVLNIASMDSKTRPIVQTAQGRLKEIYQPVEPDVLAYRLGLLENMNAYDDVVPPSSSLYASVLPKQDRATRPHQSQAELQQRAERRRLRAAKKQAKEERRRSAEKHKRRKEDGSVKEKDGRKDPKETQITQ